MKLIKYSFVGILTLVLSSCSLNTEQKKTDNESEVIEALITQTEVDQVIEKWLKLWSSYDLDLMGEIFYQSENLTYFSSEKKGLIKGYNELFPHHAGFGFVKGGKKPAKNLWLEDLDFRFYDGSVMIAGIWYFGDPSAVKETVQYGPVTFIMVKNEQHELKITHTHFANY